MSLSQMISTPCTLLLVSQAETTEDSRGNEVAGEPPEVETYCSLQQTTRDEPDDAGEFSDTGWRIFFRPGTTLPTTQDKVIVDGQTFEFVGNCWVVTDPWKGNTPNHVEGSVRAAA